MLRTAHTRTQDLIFTLYGDYLSYREDTVWIGVLIELLGTLGVSEQAVRSTASRMARKRWLKASRQGRNSYYSMTPRMADVLNKGSQRIYYPPQVNWDRHWYLVTYSFTGEQDRVRHELCKQLTWLGFGWLGNSTWISPHDRCEGLQAILDTLQARQHVDYFRAEILLAAEDGTLAERCWDLKSLNRGYQDFIDLYRPQFERDQKIADGAGALTSQHAFRQRFWLIHEYRYFPFHDPYLPDELLPANWRGHEAIDLFRSYHDLLKDKANAYIDQVMAGAP